MAFRINKTCRIKPSWEEWALKTITISPTTTTT